MSKESNQSRKQTEGTNYGKVDNTKPASAAPPGNSAPGSHKRSKQG